ncbi:hypothetical protein M9H77_29579 [Catharanthus roseus]|uniref:Uncharacterized protein n=1 Tax=Catharanthus roseus TaxID=4058 RepID=A0ACB9ZUT9_CATRO|nr:hypothetical protein M9H77_29579 [Catharanthus roseus]
MDVVFLSLIQSSTTPTIGKHDHLASSSEQVPIAWLNPLEASFQKLLNNKRRFDAKLGDTTVAFIYIIAAGETSSGTPYSTRDDLYWEYPNQIARVLESKKNIRNLEHPPIRINQSLIH